MAACALDPAPPSPSQAPPSSATTGFTHQEWMAPQLWQAKDNESNLSNSGTNGIVNGWNGLGEDGEGETTPPAPIPAAAATTPQEEPVSTMYASIPVTGKDPLSTSRPLKPFNRSAFEAAFPHFASSDSFSSDTISLASSSSLDLPSSISSATSASSPPATSPINDSEQDPFFYPLLCANERRRLSEFWYLTSGIHDDHALASHLQSLLTIVKDLYDFDIAVIQFIDNDRSSSIDMNGWQEGCCPRRETTCAHTMMLRPGTVLSVSDFMNDPRFANNKRLVEGRVRSYAGAPLGYTIDGTSESISLGSLCVFSFINQKPPLTALQRESLCRFADLAMHAIKDRSRLRREHVQTRRHEALTHLAKTVGPPSHVVEMTLSALSTTLGGKASFVECRDGAVQLRNVGYRVPLSQFEGGLWENINAVEDFIKYHNHESSLNYDANCTLRAIAVPLTNVLNHYLVVETDKLRDIYDGTDTLFVQSCAMVIAGSIQDGLLRQALEAKSTFLRNAQHAFRTSLNGILSATDMLLGEGSLHDDSVDKAKQLLGANPEGTTPLDLLRIIETSGRGLLTVINHLIDLDAQNVTANMDLCDMHEIEEEVLDSIVQHSSKEKMKDLLMISESLLDGKNGDCIVSDRLLLRQIVASLVQNAVEATNGGGLVMVKIRLAGQAGIDQSLDVEVYDTGVGIADSDKERIFQPFEKCNTFTPNAGLGLSFACQYAATLGGSVTLIQSEPNKGSLFKLSLPNPILASSLQTHRRRSKLPKAWSYWMHDGVNRYGSETIYCAALQRLGLQLAPSKLEASMVILPVTRGSPRPAEVHALSASQVLLMLGVGEDYHADHVDTGDHSLKTVYGRFPWTRNRLIATLMQAQKMVARGSEGTGRLTPVEELANLTLSQAETPDVVRALLVDDNAMNLNILQAYCKKRKYEFQSARDGKEAFLVYVKACEAGLAPTLVLLDLQMPVCDGISCASMIRAYEKRENKIKCPIIMVTAQSGDIDRRGAFEAGTDAYYVKPLRVSTLDDIVARYARN